ncbi:MAG: sigma-70 family RNA polymerase sigma factor [Actinomycetota bacterium]|nr:sigma-70 family RNA polymerase sigma factor [Actinomycetota bacterium]
MAAMRLRAEAEISGCSDAQLVRAGSTGDRGVFAELYRRHAGVALRVARAVAANDDDAADAAADAFSRVFDSVVSGRAPSMEFRAYLIAATRNAAIDQRRRSERREPGRPSGVPAVDAATSGDEGTDRPGPSEALAASEDSKLVTEAFQGLPARWQSVLWLTEVEGVPAREAAGVLGLSPNNVAQLAVRARARLRERYLQAHVRNHAQPRCQRTVDQLGAYLAGTLAEGRRARVDEHLRGCPTCRERLSEVEDLGVSLRRALVPIPFLAMGWLRRARSRRMRALSTSAGPSVPAPARGPTAGAAVAATRSPLCQTLAELPVSALVMTGVAVDTAARSVLRGAAVVLAAVPLLSGIGGTQGRPVAVAVGASVQPAPTTTVARPAAVPAAPSPPPVVEAVDPLPATAHPSTSVAQALKPVIDVFGPDGVRVMRSLDNPQTSGAPLVFVVVGQQPGWLKVLVPIRPNGTTGWVRRQDVSVTTHTFSIVVELGVHRITVFKGTEPFLREPVGVGTPSTPTPLGLSYTKELIAENPSGPYGPYAFGLSAFSDVLTQFNGGEGVIGLHGTNEPSALGSDVSHGCIRMSNRGITSLAQTLPLGVPVEVRA